MVKIYNVRNDDLDDFQQDNDLLPRKSKRAGRRNKLLSTITHHPQMDTNIDKQELYDEGLSGLIEKNQSKLSSKVIGYNPEAAH